MTGLRTRATALTRTSLYGVFAGLIAVLLGYSPAVADPVRDAQWHLAYLDIDDAHKSSQGEGIIVGVIDTGVDLSHPDLSGTVLPGLTLTPAGGDGRRDDAGHGTGLAGLIAAHGRALGIAPKAKILTVRATDGLISGHIEGGVRWAVDHGATVVCLAYNSGFNEQANLDIQYAISRNVVVIAAVGNTDLPGGPYPAAFPGVVGAAGVDRNGNHAATSEITANAMLAAPGVDIASTDTLSVPGHTGYSVGTGTSAATAIIAGAAALVRAKFPNLSAVEVIHRLTATADDKGPPGRDDQYGYGVINLVKALTADVPPLTPSAVPTTVGPTASGPEPSGPDRTGLWTALGALAILAALGAAAAIAGFVRLRGRGAK